jgi:hypothetical protein
MTMIVLANDLVVGDQAQTLDAALAYEGPGERIFMEERQHVEMLEVRTGRLRTSPDSTDSCSGGSLAARAAAYSVLEASMPSLAIS